MFPSRMQLHELLRSLSFTVAGHSPAGVGDCISYRSFYKRFLTHQLSTWQVVQWVTLLASFHYLLCKGNLLPNHEDECHTLPTSTSSCSPNPAHIFARITWEVKKYNMIHPGKVNSAGCSEKQIQLHQSCYIMHFIL